MIEYEESMGGINLSNEQLELLKGLPLEEQKKQFQVILEENAWDIIYGERERKPTTFKFVGVEECRHVKNWVVKDGVIVGVIFTDHYSKTGTAFRSLDRDCPAFYEHIPDGIGGSTYTADCTLIFKPLT